MTWKGPCSHLAWRQALSPGGPPLGALCKHHEGDTLQPLLLAFLGVPQLWALIQPELLEATIPLHDQLEEKLSIRIVHLPLLPCLFDGHVLA